MSVLNGQWIELFRAGDYGDKGSYSAADIDKMVANYDPAKHEAPVVMGHPEHDAPSYGWVEQLRRVGNVLLGKLKQVPAQFEELVRSGRFKKRSISFYKTENGPSLRHVGFLGAMPPEVKGLADVKLAHFSAEAGAGVAIEFKEEEDVDANEVSKSIVQSMKEFFTELFKGKKIEDLGEADRNKVIADAVKAATEPLQKQFSDMSTQLTTEKAEREKAARNASTQTQAAFAETQIKRVKDARRWVPAFDKMGLPQIFAELAKSEIKVSFGEGNKKTEKPVAEVFADFMIGLGEIVPTRELAGGAARNAGNLVQFTEPARKDQSIDPDSVALAEAATALAQKEKISYGDALKRIRSTGDYVHAGAAASGAV